MFQILKTDKSIDFMRWSKFAFIFSILMIGASIFTLSTKWLNWGLDFTGGTLTARDVMVRLRPRENVASEALGNQILSAIKDGTGESYYTWYFLASASRSGLNHRCGIANGSRLLAQRYHRCIRPYP